MTCGQGVEEAVGEGDDFRTLVAAGHDFVVVDELVLIGGDEETTTELNIGPAFAFGHPFGVLFEEGVKFFSGGNLTPFQQAVADEEDVFDEVVVKFGDFLELDDLPLGEWVVADFGERAMEFFFKLVELGKVVGGGVDDAGLFVGSTPFADPGASAHGFFDALFPVPFFTPAGEFDFGGQAAGEFDGFARGVPGEIQVGREVDVCFKNIAVDFDAVRLVVFF